MVNYPRVFDFDYHMLDADNGLWWDELSRLWTEKTGPEISSRMTDCLLNILQAYLLHGGWVPVDEKGNKKRLPSAAQYGGGMARGLESH